MKILVVLQEMAKEETERKWPFQSFLNGYSKQFGNQGHLTPHISFFHALHLPFSHHIHDLEALECFPGRLAREKAQSRLHQTTGQTRHGLLF